MKKYPEPGGLKIIEEPEVKEEKPKKSEKGGK